MEERIPDAKKCLDQLTYYIDSMIAIPLSLQYYKDKKLTSLSIKENWPVYGLGVYGLIQSSRIIYSVSHVI